MKQLTIKARDYIQSAFGVELRRARTQNVKFWDCLIELTKVADPPTDEETSFISFCRKCIASSRAQLLQDLFVIWQLDKMKEGFFVEVGATDGMYLSNTFLLESDYGWNGIVVEPARVWHQALSRNRKCVIDLRCVAADSGKRIVFNETNDPKLSTIDRLSSGDMHAAARAVGVRYEVETVRLNDILKEHRAPKTIDYLSVDTEGSELSILETLDFSAYTPRIITVEHNFVKPSRLGIELLLTSKGYTRKFQEFSMFDDWYVLQSNSR